ncbi:MAG: efflux RND transporter periplasmic adaptor subunit [Cyclobacteriaceae bacterium]
MRFAFTYLIFVLLFSCQQAQETVSPEYRSLTTAVYASGSIEPVNAYQVFAPVQGILQQKLVEAGEEVREGQVLFVISQENTSLLLENAQQALETARREADPNSAALRELQLRLENAKERFQQDSLNYKRQQNLIAKNATSQQAVEQAKIAFISSRNALASIRISLEESGKNRQDALERAQIQYRMAAEAQGNTLVKSRINGKVYQIYLKEGEMVNLNQPLAEVGEADRFYLSLIVDERDIAKITPGKEVLFTTDILEDTLLRAEVSKIYPYMEQATRSFQVEASLPAYELPFYNGASVEANIIVSRKERTMVIPRSALIGEDSVLVDMNGEVEKVQIRKGIENLEMVEVLEGIEEDTKLITKR